MHGTRASPHTHTRKHTPSQLLVAASSHCHLLHTRHRQFSTVTSLMCRPFPLSAQVSVRWQTHLCNPSRKTPPGFHSVDLPRPPPPAPR